jgi:hypothetical protein
VVRAPQIMARCGTLSCGKFHGSSQNRRGYGLSAAGYSKLGRPFFGRQCCTSRFELLTSPGPIGHGRRVVHLKVTPIFWGAGAVGVPRYSQSRVPTACASRPSTDGQLCEVRGVEPLAVRCAALTRDFAKQRPDNPGAKTGRQIPGSRRAVIAV